MWSGRCVLADRMVGAAGCFETSVNAPDCDVTYQNVIVFVVTGSVKSLIMIDFGI